MSFSAISIRDSAAERVNERRFEQLRRVSFIFRLMGYGGFLAHPRTLLLRQCFLYAGNSRGRSQLCFPCCFLLRLHHQRLAYSPLGNRVFLAFVGMPHSFYNVTVVVSFQYQSTECNFSVKYISFDRLHPDGIMARRVLAQYLISLKNRAQGAEPGTSGLKSMLRDQHLFSNRRHSLRYSMLLGFLDRGDRR